MGLRVDTLRWRAKYLACALIALAACKSGDAPGHITENRPAPAQAAPQPTVRPSREVAVAAHPTQAAEKTHVEWPTSIEWHSWQEALAKARAESKPIMVIVYADWCPKCRALAPVLDDPEIVRLSKKMVVVRQNHDEEAPWLDAINEKFGGYVPRIFFFDSTGKMREDVTSGHPQYPYFYAAQQIEFLRRSMRQVAGT